jgi:hypothetical protein
MFKKLIKSAFLLKLLFENPTKMVGLFFKMVRFGNSFIIRCRIEMEGYFQNGVGVTLLRRSKSSVAFE